MILSCLQCLWPFAQKETDLTQDDQAQDHEDKGEHKCAPKVVTESCRESPISADMVENMVNQLVPSLQGGGPLVCPFLPVRIPTVHHHTEHVLDLLLKRFTYFCLDCEEDEQIKSVLCSFLDSWIDIYPEEFCQTGNLSILKKLKAYLDCEHALLQSESPCPYASRGVAGRRQ
ncbi:ral guanine nucleotide dissociation stimulator-like [Rattus rattus]|uniref:ral guanine nucleotide dissociation stimulator-like n=1 Tax=Rattus rattus TaxID=10117 RepID=UPI0013F38915|nr:ral guanine nucleotide dissociation stimulator-like [Rattus rattus]